MKVDDWLCPVCVATTGQVGIRLQSYGEKIHRISASDCNISWYIKLQECCSSGSSCTITQTSNQSGDGHDKDHNDQLSHVQVLQNILNGGELKLAKLA